MAHLTRTLVTAFALGLATAPAFARPQPVPPPSGIVYHLFGPDSLSSHILPSAPQAAPASPAGSTPANGAATPAASPASTPSGPSWGDVAHQMFVTGDPAQEGAAALPKGKAAGF
jgi:hypothetical protein